MTSVAVGAGTLQWESAIRSPNDGAVAVGGRQGYVEVLNSDGSHDSHVVADEDLVMGVSWDYATGTLYLVSSDDEIGANIPHDLVYFHDGSGVLVALVVGTGVLELRKYSLTGTLLDTWTPTPPVGWGQQHVRIDLACDSESVLIGWHVDRMTRFNLGTGLDETPYQTLAVDSPYLYGGVRWASRESGDNRDAITAMSRSGTGPRRAIARGADGTLWTDVINPAGDYKVVKRTAATGAFVASYTTQATPTPTNDETLALAVNWNGCGARERVWISSIGV